MIDLYGFTPVTRAWLMSRFELKRWISRGEAIHLMEVLKTEPDDYFPNGKWATIQHLEYLLSVDDDELPLFEPKKLARNTDPSTSKSAAQRVGEFCGNHQRAIYDALKNMKDGTFYEIADYCGLDVPAVWRRLNEMEKAKLICLTGEQRVGPSGRLCRVWAII